MAVKKLFSLQVVQQAAGAGFRLKSIGKLNGQTFKLFLSLHVWFQMLPLLNLRMLAVPSLKLIGVPIGSQLPCSPEQATRTNRAITQKTNKTLDFICRYLTLRSITLTFDKWRQGTTP